MSPASEGQEATPVAFKLLARACNADMGKKGENAKALRQRLGMSDTTNGDIRGLYVGISALDYLPVLLVTAPGWSKDHSAANSDNLGFLKLEGQSEPRLDGRDIVWLESMLVPGNIAHLKSALWNNLQGQEKLDFVQTMTQENRLLETGLNPLGIAKTLPSNEAPERKPEICRAIHDGPNYDTLHYKLRWPPMAALKFPLNMIKDMEDFLSSRPYDNIPLNIALAATIIYYDLENDGWTAEGFLSHINAEGQSLRPANLTLFVLYFPHMLKYVELKRLTNFLHPSRFAVTHESRDEKIGVYAKIGLGSLGQLDSKAMRQWYSEIKSRYPQISKKFRFNLLPSSMPGTAMIFPRDCIDSERPSADLFSLCCLNDIRTLGLPSYHPVGNAAAETNGRESFRHVRGPKWLFTKYLNPHNHTLQGDDRLDYETSKPASIFTANTEYVFPDVTSDHYTGNKDIADSVERRFGDSRTKDFAYRRAHSRNDRRERSLRTKELYRVAAYFKVSVDELDSCLISGYPKWTGRDNHIQELKDQGIFESIISGNGPQQVAKRPNTERNSDDPVVTIEDEVEPAPKRPRISERRLDATIKAKIEDLLENATVLSRDWDIVIAYLQSNGPTREGTQRSLSQVQSLVTGIEEELRSENATNGKGNLEEVIRLTFRAAGFEPEFALMAYEKKSVWQTNAVSRFGDPLKQTIEDLCELRPLKSGFKFAIPIIKALYEDPMIQDQITIFREIDALLKE